MERWRKDPVVPSVQCPYNAQRRSLEKNSDMRVSRVHLKVQWKGIQTCANPRRLVTLPMQPIQNCFWRFLCAQTLPGKSMPDTTSRQEVSLPRPQSPLPPCTSIALICVRYEQKELQCVVICAELMGSSGICLRASTVLIADESGKEQVYSVALREDAPLHK